MISNLLQCEDGFMKYNFIERRKSYIEIEKQIDLITWHLLEDYRHSTIIINTAHITQN